MINDPVQSLVDFVQDIKPFHTKIVEILVDYIYQESVSVDVAESLKWNIGLDLNYSYPGCPDGYGMGEWEGVYQKTLDTTLDIDSFLNEKTGTYVQLGQLLTTPPLPEMPHTTNVVSISSPDVMFVPGNQLSYFPVNRTFTISNSFSNDGTWNVVNVNYDLVTNRTRIQVEYVSNQLTLGMFAVHTPTARKKEPPYEDMGYHKNFMYVAGQLINYFGPGQTFTIHDSTHFHNGTWSVSNIHDDVYFSELTVQHVTSTVPGGTIFTSVSEDPTPHWSTGLYWYDTTLGVMKMWNGNSWDEITYDVFISPIAPLGTLNIGTIWFHTIEELMYEYTGNSWIQMDSERYIVGTQPSAANQLFDGPIVENIIPNYEITKVSELTQTPISNPDFGSTEGVATTTMSNPLEPSAQFEVGGNQVDNFTVNNMFIVKDSEGNDGIWKIHSVSYNLVSNRTEIKALFDRMSTVDDESSGNPNDLFITWDPVFGFGLGGFDLDVPLTSGKIEITIQSNFDLPTECPTVSQTTASAHINEDINFQVSLPTIPLAIIDVQQRSGLTENGKFTIRGNYVKSFVTDATFVVSQSGSNDGIWTVVSSSFVPSMGPGDPNYNGTTIIEVSEFVPLIVYPLGSIMNEVVQFRDTIGIEIFEGPSPTSWDMNYYSAPTTAIQQVVGSDTIKLKGNVARFYSVGSKVTLNNGSAWSNTVLTSSYDRLTDETTISTLETTIVPTPSHISGQPTWLKGVGWGTSGWATESDPWITIVLHPLDGGDDWSVISNYDIFVGDQGAFGSGYYDEGGFGDIIQQVLPL